MISKKTIVSQSFVFTITLSLVKEKITYAMKYCFVFSSS